MDLKAWAFQLHYFNLHLHQFDCRVCV